MSSTQLTINFNNVIPIFLQNCNKKSYYSKNQLIEFKTAFYSFFYQYRVENNLVNSYNCILTGKQLKLILHKAVVYFNNELGYDDLSYQSILYILCYTLNVRSIQDNQEISIINMNIELGRNIKTKLLNQYKNIFSEIKNDVIGWAIFLLLRFNWRKNKEVVPFEIFSILIYDSYNYFLRNKAEFSIGNGIYKRFLMEDCISMRIEQYNRKVVSCIRTVPPFKNDVWMNISPVNIDRGHSLPLLCHYFGHDSWYDLYPLSMQINDKKEYYNFKFPY